VLELRVRGFEGDIVPVEGAARLRCAREERDEDGAAEGLVFADAFSRVRLAKIPAAGSSLSAMSASVASSRRPSRSARASTKDPISGLYS